VIYLQDFKEPNKKTPDKNRHESNSQIVDVLAFTEII